MFGPRLTNTSTANLKPLGTAPQRSFELITETVQAEFGDDHAALFAEPVATEFGDRFDWYAITPGMSVALIDLDPERQAEARARLNALRAEIDGKAQALLTSDNSDDQRLGEALAHAVQFPGDEAVFVVTTPEGRLQPVLTNWAWVAETETKVHASLTGIDPTPRSQPRPIATAPVAAPVATPVAAPANWWWLLGVGWLLLALLIAAVIYLMIAPCALRLPFTANSCVMAAERPPTALDDQAVLRDQIALLERRLGAADRACQPDPRLLPIPEPVQRADRIPLPDATERAERQGAQIGDLTFTLIWQGRDDLDLSVTCPSGQMLNFLNTAVCQGRLDVDSNNRSVTTEPVENAFFNDPLPGAYRIGVRFFKDREGTGPQRFKLQIRDGDATSSVEGQVSVGARAWTHTYNYRGE